ncbi:hypothetical protein [Skermania piniformis]|uniref:Uncharacterized protein n=1 Tax=Skermania pinensis TaxID=39122 RepID=A0ABX8SBH9_9ACTN|nr:hypothetical protein [Skermania piniformis]QXQ13940.1 hypothetical protein KV203_00185 [Skermania piniformis]
MDAVEIGPDEPVEPAPELRVVRRPQADFRASGGVPATDAERPRQSDPAQARLLLELLEQDDT